MSTQQKESPVDTAVRAFEAAITAKSTAMLEEAYRQLASLPKSTLDEHSPQLGPWFAGRLPELPRWHAAVYAVFVGALVEWRADAAACAPSILRGLHQALERAVELVPLWREQFGPDADLPDPASMPSGELQDSVGEVFADRWYAPYLGWLTVRRWEQAAVAVLADPRVRAALRTGQGLEDIGTDAAELVRLTERLEPDLGDLQCIQRALLLLDDEPLLVLDRASGRAFRMRMSGVSDTYQLQTLLAGALIGGGYLPGEPPSAEAVAFSRDAPFDPERLDELPYAMECFNFAEPSGRWVRGEMTPSRIPVVDGVRQLVVDPPVMRHYYRAVRFFPRVPGRVELEAVLEPQEAAPYFAAVAPLVSWQEACGSADDAR